MGRVENLNDLVLELGCKVGVLPSSYLGLLLGAPFKFVAAWYEVERVVNDFENRARPDDTLETMIDREIEQECAKQPSSASRSLIRVKRSIIMLRVMFEQMLSSRENSIEGAVSKSYEQSFAAFHGWASRTAVFASLPHLPTRDKLMKKLTENEASMTVKMQSFIDSSAILVQYIRGLFHSRESAKELLEQI
ncbi:hypothetical protein PVL29_006356 [Vitis rotundifolia]|uniref:Glycolipid transfer protein domain-containing protein n=1 Tax=Vitis rotundifolia TaxID=103349 RepID=A0AA39A4U7_VITRO|nr:hypothetical protein PVL29_006356 [Vitis rotundifolia]